MLFRKCASLFDNSAMRPVLSAADQTALRFVGMVGALSVPLWILGGVTQRQLAPGLPLSALMTVCPLAAATALAYQREGGAGVCALLCRAGDARRMPTPLWYLPILLLNPGVAITTYGLLRARGVAVPRFTVSAGGALGLSAVFALAAVGEEVGWSGYALDPLIARWGPPGAGLVLGAVWAAWHLIPYRQAGRSWEWIGWQCLKTVASRVLTVWIYTGAGKSVWATILFHASDNLSVFLFPRFGSHYDPRLTGLILTALAAAVTAGARDTNQATG